MEGNESVTKQRGRSDYVEAGVEMVVMVEIGRWLWLWWRWWCGSGGGMVTNMSSYGVCEGIKECSEFTKYLV